MQSQTQEQKFEIDVDNFGMDDYNEVRINGEYFLFLNLLAIENIFNNAFTTPEGIKDMFLKYQFQIGRLEDKMRAMDDLPESYDDEIRQYKYSDDYIKAPSDFVRETNLAKKRESLLQRRIARKRPINKHVRV